MNSAASPCGGDIHPVLVLAGTASNALMLSTDHYYQVQILDAEVRERPAALRSRSSSIQALSKWSEQLTLTSLANHR